MNQTPLSLDQLMNWATSSMEKIADQWPKAQTVFSEPLDTEIAQTPYSVIYEEDRVKLKYYKPPVKSRYTTPLFIVYALINRETMLDLQPDRSVVQQLLKNGIDLYILDWGYPSRKDRFQTIDDHINGYVNNAVDVILKRHGINQLNLMGVCMGGTFCTAYAALHPEKVKNLLLTVAPTSFDTDAGLLHTWWGNKGFDVDRFIDLHGNAPGDFLNTNFLLLNPAKLLIDKYIDFTQNMHNKNYVQNFLRMEQWIFDSPDVPGETFREFIKQFYQENRLIQNKLEVGGAHVDLKRITMPVLNIYAQYDHLVPPAACSQITQAVGSSDTRDVCLKTGHVGIYVSSKAQREFAPTICEWLKARDAEPDNADTSDKMEEMMVAGNM